VSFEECPQCGSNNISDPPIRKRPAECLDCDWIEQKAGEEEVDELLRQVDEETAIRIKDGDLPDKYVIEENGVVIRVCQYTETDEWKRCLYSNLVSVHKRWIKQALNDRWSSFEGVEVISREQVPDIDGTTCIGRYCEGDGLYICSECGEEIEGGMPFAIHSWDEHGITEDPRQYRDPARGQMSLGERWSA
jgi:hypothetical protein